MSLPKKIEQRASKEGNNVILITGSNGYVGGYVLRTLAQSGPAQHVKGLVRSEAQADKIRRYGALPAIGDVTDPASLTRAMAGVDVVIHLAAVNRDRGASTMARINAEGTRNVVNAAKAAGVTRIINLVGLGADESRPYPLASTQGQGVRAIIESGIPYTILETSVIFGEGDEFINTLAGLARIPPFMVVPGDGKTAFQPMAAADVAACIVKAVDLPETLNQRLQICGSEVLTLEAIIDAIMAEMGIKRVKLKIPAGLLKLPVALMDKLLPRPPVTPSLLGMLGVNNTTRDNKTETVFGVTPLRLRDGIAFVRKMTLGKLIRRSLGKGEYR